MKKMTFLWIALLFACSFILAAQETDNGTDSLFNVSVSGEALWAPLVYRGDMDGIVGTDAGADQEGSGLGVGASGWGGIGAALNFAVWGSYADDSIGYRVHIQPQAQNGNFTIADSTAYLWARPFPMLKIQLGNYQWSEMSGKIGPIGQMYGGSWGNYGGNEDDIFQSLASNTFGTMIILTPPSSAPDLLQGLMLFSSFGVSGWMDTNDNERFSARAGKLWRYIYSTPHIGLAYRNEAFGLARLQFIGGSYYVGDGSDFASMQNVGMFHTLSFTHGFFPARSQPQSQLELALNYTAIPMLNLDLGFAYGFPVTVRSRDGSTGRGGIGVGPTFEDLGYRRQANWVTNDRLAQQVDDVWQPPVKIALGLEYNHEPTGLGLRFRTKLEFGEEIAFSDGSEENYIAGFRFEAGLEPSYTINNIGRVSMYTALQSQQNGSFNGRVSDNENRNEIGINSINNNGTVDLGLGAFFTRPFKNNYSNYIKTGISANLPISGDRYFWSDESLTSGDFGADWTEAYRKGKLIITIPIILAISF